MEPLEARGFRSRPISTDYHRNENTPDQIRTYKRCSYVGSSSWMCQFGPTSKNYICNIGPKYVVSERKEFAEKKHSNSKFKEENSSHFYSCGLQRVVVRKVCFIAFFLPPLLGEDGGFVVTGLLIRSCQSYVGRLGMHRLGYPGPLTHLFRNLPWTPKISLLDFLYRDFMDQFEGSRRLGDTSENNSVARESSCVIILKSRLNSTCHFARTR